jgi:hypothetical protein
MNEIKVNYLKREFKDVSLLSFKREPETTVDPEDLERKRCFELIYLDSMVYLVIKEAVKELLTEEIYFNLIVIRFNPKTNQVKELFKK